MKIISVVSARLKFMKVAPIYSAFAQFKIENSPIGMASQKLKI